MNETLHLPLKAKWYDMIESGEKTEEYRVTKPYWIKRFCDLYKKGWCEKDRITTLLKQELVYETYEEALSAGINAALEALENGDIRKEANNE